MPPQPPPSPKWHQQAPFVVLSLICCWPVGLALLWASPSFTKTAKGLWTMALVTLIGLGAIGAAVAPKKAEEPRSASAVQSQPSRPSETMIQVEARALIAAYKANEVRADAQYKGKIVEVTGIVGDIKKDVLDNIYVTIGTGARYEHPEVHAFFDDAAEAQAALLSKGDTVKIRGRVGGLMMNVLVNDCVFVR